MALFLLDTSTLSHLLRRNPRALERLDRLVAPDRVLTCTIAVGELQYGLERMPQGRKRNSLAEGIGELLRWLTIEPISVETARAYSRIKASAERRGQRMEENDLWIAATAISLGAVLVSADGDFERVGAPLELEDWTK
ncbi:MAG: type II toxin-antitoxin system VapC family toxin [Planctomycetes bacterium]|nr:type II toxin-antitoxin system VapC family toxin [Planctomycetota bacterium]